MLNRKSRRNKTGSTTTTATNNSNGESIGVVIGVGANANSSSLSSTTAAQKQGHQDQEQDSENSNHGGRGRAKYSYGNTNGSKSKKSNNIVLVSNTEFNGGGAGDTRTSKVPPSCVDNLLDFDDEECCDYDENDLNRRIGSWSIADKCEGIIDQADDRVDYFSPPVITSVTSLNPNYNTNTHKGAVGSSSISKSKQLSSLPNPILPVSVSTPTPLPTAAKGQGQESIPDLQGQGLSSASSCRSGSYSRYSYSGGDKSPDSSSSYGGGGYTPTVTECTTVWDGLKSCQLVGCPNGANKKCSQCKGAYYCTEDHQKEDWKRHKHQCIPYRVQNVGLGAADLDVDDEYGLEGQEQVCAAVACRNIAAGQVIFSEKPMLVFPLADPKDFSFDCVMNLYCVMERAKNKKDDCELLCNANRPACLGCLKVVEFIGPPRYKCSKCALPLCSYNCQFLSAHQAGECDAISSANVTKADIIGSCYHTLYMDVEILRTLQLEKYSPLQWDQFLEMKNNVRVETYRKSSSFLLFAQNYEILVPISAKMSGYNRDLISDVHSIISALSYRPSLYASFKLLFSTQPLFAHDCVPNTIQYIEDEFAGDQSRMKLVTKAATSIMKTEIITLDFTSSPYVSYTDRRRILSDLLGITNCLCKRCQYPQDIKDLTLEIKCPNCQCGSIRPENPKLWNESVWSCHVCQEEISYAKVRAIEVSAHREYLEILEEPKIDRSILLLRDFIKRKSSLELNPQHEIIINAWCSIEHRIRYELFRARNPEPSHIYTLKQMEYFELLGMYAETMFQHLEAIRPGIWIDKGIVQFHRFYSRHALTARKFQEGHLLESEYITNFFKNLNILKNSLETLSIYEGYNEPNVIVITQEVTSVLSQLKDYMNEYLKKNKNNASTDNNKLPSLN